jgi:hypothetical protein
LHVDCAVRGFFPAEHGPKATHRKAEVVRILSQAEGLKLVGGVVATFELSLTELPRSGVIRSLYAQQGRAGVAVRFLEGRLRVTGAPLSSVRWLVRESEERVRVELRGEQSTQVSETYLEEALQWARKQLDSFVLGGAPDETP